MSKVKRNQPLKKMMNAYCENQHLMKEGLRFLHEDQRLTEEDTPMDLDMEDNDVIQVHVCMARGGHGLPKVLLGLANRHALQNAMGSRISKSFPNSMDIGIYMVQVMGNQIYPNLSKCALRKIMGWPPVTARPLWPKVPGISII
jgi:hypothetical protein